MFGYEFIGWQALSDATSNAVFPLWVLDHSGFLMTAWGLWYAFAKITPWKWDDKLAEDAKKAVEDAVKI
jgi:hypothetical protein